MFQPALTIISNMLRHTFLHDKIAGIWLNGMHSRKMSFYSGKMQMNGYSIYAW